MDCSEQSSEVLNISGGSAMPKNYYIILGIPFDSTQEDIKSAYRRLAKKFHPDLYGKDQAPFQIIQEAYTVLGNPGSRKDYDISLKPSVKKVSVSSNSKPLHPYHEDEIEPLIPDDKIRGERITALDRSFPHQGSMFDTMFEQFLSGFKEHTGKYRASTNDLNIEIILTPVQARRGGNVRLNLPVQMHCPTCYRHSGFAYNCWRCDGTGVLQGEKTVLVSYPAGIVDNHTMKLAISDFGDQPLYLNAIFKIR
jgi:molecular chaperone DnaJ